MTKPLMTYIRSDNSTQSAYGARKYTGAVATGYDAKRKESPKWAAEQRIIEEIIDGLPKGSHVLDVPVGTGRFIPAYERCNHRWFGVDLSKDMLSEARRKATINKASLNLHQGNVTELHMVEKLRGIRADLSIMCRLTRWLSPEERTQALKQLQRITKEKIVFTARTANHPHAYPVEDIQAALDDDWKIADNFECGEPDYRVIVLRRV